MYLKIMKFDMQARLSILFCALACILMSLILWVCKGQIFTGISDSDISYVADLGTIPYKVTDIMELKGSDGTSSYSIHFDSVVEDAPSFDTKTNVIPAGLSLNSEFNAEWCHVAAVYDNYVRDKDLIAMEYTGVTISDEKIAELKEQCGTVLKADLANRVNPFFKWFTAILLIVNVLCCLALMNIAGNISHRYHQNNVWYKLQSQITETMGHVSESYCGLNLSELKMQDMPEVALPFRFWADDAEYEEYLKHRKSVDKGADTSMDFDASIDAVEMAKAKSSGAYYDININDDKSAYVVGSNFEPVASGSMTDVRKTSGNRSLGGSKGSSLPQSSLSGIVRKRVVK